MADFSNKQVLALVRRRHPEYSEMKAHWEFLELTYKGGRKWFDMNIFQYHKEGDVEYKERIQRAYRFNHTREVCDLVNKYLFRATINRNTEEASESLKDFWKNCTFHGLSIDDFIWSVSLKGSQTGRPWIIVDNGNTGITDSTSKREEIKGSIYAYIVTPSQVLDMSYDDVGNLNWILIEELYRDDTDPWDDLETPSNRYRLWTQNEWMLMTPVVNKLGTKGDNPDKLGNRVKFVTTSGTHGLGVVPAIRADNVLSTEPWTSSALISDIAYLDRAVANYASNLDAIIQDQTFSQLAMPAQNLMPGEDGYEKVLEMGTKRAFLYDGEGGAAPHYISPDPRQASLILAAIGTLISEIYHSVGLAGERTKQDNSKGIDNSSGVAKAADFERVTALLQAKAKSLEFVENQMVDLVYKWSGDTPPAKSLVGYPETFDVATIADEFYIAMQLSIIDTPGSIRGKHMKGLLRKLFPNMKETDLISFEGDIDEWTKMLKERAESGDLAKDLRSGLMEEGKRNRSQSGEKQSQTKSRDTGDSLQSQGRETES